jgi:putative FmdB family regulatory protein
MAGPGFQKILTPLLTQEELNVPIYEYLCLECKKPFSCLVGVVADSEEPRCERCGGTKLRKLISRVARVRSKESSLEDLADPSKLGNMDDPKAMARWAKEMGRSMADETGELPGDFDEMMENGPLEEGDQD